LKITVYFSASEAKPGVVAKSTVVYGDVLRFGTTVATFLYHGAAGVSVHPDPGAAKKAFAKLKRGEGLLAGERDGEKIPGFHLSGSPLESSRDKIKGRTICFSSPDAAGFLKATQGAEKVFLGGIVNLGSVYESALRSGKDIVVIAAGYEGKPTLPDTVFAGLVADFLQNTVASHPIELAESAKKAVADAKAWQGRLIDLMRGSDEGKMLARVGCEKDVDFAAKLSRLSSAPVLQDGLFVRDLPPKFIPRAPGEGVPPAPRKGKPIKVQVPLFPKNPEHPTPGQLSKAAAITAKAASSVKTAPVTPLVVPEAGKKKGAKNGGKKLPLFSKKTVAPLQLKAQVHHGHGAQAATDALKAALSKLDAKAAKATALAAKKSAAAARLLSKTQAAAAKSQAPKILKPTPKAVPVKGAKTAPAPTKVKTAKAKPAARKK